MTPIDRDEGPQEDSLPFERWLLDSARADELPEDVSGAWARFGASLASVGRMSALGAAAGGARVGGGIAAAATRGTRIWAAKWLIVGAFVGSALTLLAVNRVRHSHAGEGAHPANIAVVASVAPSLVAPPSSAVEASSALVPPPLAPLAQESPTVARSSSVPRNVRHGASSLSAQVALVEAARVAVATGAFAEALHATARYEREFPRGQLLPDAEVLAVEALSARGDRDACRERAARFVARYPNDPHVARVKALAER
jgi:hypothetical protein